MWRKLSREEFMDKAKAVVVGHAVADAVGVPYEFSCRVDLDERPATDMIGGGAHDMPRGSWSDDTGMALCTLDAFKEAAGEEDIHSATMTNFTRWLNFDEYTPTGVLFDCGVTCSTAITRGRGLDDEGSNGNGSLMRIHPYVLKNFYEINEKGGQVSKEDASRYLRFVADGSKLTHAHPRSVLACQLYAGVLTKLLVSPKKSSVKEGLAAALEAIRADNDSYDFVREELDEKQTYQRVFDGMENFTRDEIQSGGYVVHTFEAALWSLMTTDTYRDCVLAAVNLGRDTDTVAAIAGGLAGALYGYDAIPKEWREGLLRRDYIELLCEKAFH